MNNTINNSMYGVKRAMIRKLIVQETGTYDDQFRRPYNTSLDGSTQREIIETISDNPKLTPTAMATVANQFIRPSATPESTIIIPNGWYNKRVRYLLDIVTEDNIGNYISEYVVGYTDVPGISAGLHLDPNMIFYVNAISLTRTTIHRTPLGNQTMQNLIDSSHVISNDQYIGALNNNKMYGLLPENIFRRIDALEYSSNLTDVDPNAFLLDTTSNITRNGIKSKRSNNIVPVYATNILNAYNNALVDYSHSYSEARENAAMMVKSESARSDTFMRFLKERNEYNGTNNQFTLRDLEAFDPNVRNVTTVVPTADGYLNNLHQRGMTASWSGSDMTTLFATTLSQSVPSYMLGYTINKIKMFSTNMDISNTINTTVVDLRAFNDGPDMAQKVTAFVSKFENELIKGLTYNGMISYQLEMNVDLLGETWIKISLNGEPFIDYVCPSFADGLMSPIVTQNEEVINTIANDFDNILTTIGQNTNNTGYHQDSYSGLF